MTSPRSWFAPRSTPGQVTSTITRPCTDHGWLRRPELDRIDAHAWERPDGAMVMARPGEMPMITTRKVVR